MIDKEKTRKGSSRSRNSKNVKSRNNNGRKKNLNSSGSFTNKRNIKKAKKAKKTRSIIGIVLLSAACAGIMLILSRKSLIGSSGTDISSESSDKIKIFDENHISYDLYIDVSGVFPEKQELLNVKGMNREDLRKCLSDFYKWDVAVLNANPSISDFIMPDIKKKTDENEADSSIDPQGTVQEVIKKGKKEETNQTKKQILQ